MLLDTLLLLVLNALLNTKQKGRLRDKNEKNGSSDLCRKAFEYFAFPGIISTWICDQFDEYLIAGRNILLISHVVFMGTTKFSDVQ